MSGENQLNIPGGEGQPFSGKARLFPLPNFVLFPHVVRGLHIFEPRYCAMLQAALTTDNLITMATLTSGWELNYQGSPKIHPVVCIGQIIRHQPTEDGRHNILLRGFARARVVQENEQVEPFRIADVELIRDGTWEVEAARVNASCVSKSIARIFHSISKFFPGVPLASLLQHQTLSQNSVNELSYMIASLLPLQLEAQLALLEETCPINRIDFILQWLATTTGQSLEQDAPDPPTTGNVSISRDGDFPPNFSLN